MNWTALWAGAAIGAVVGSALGFAALAGYLSPWWLR